ncbi:MAG: hypothetical protein ACTHJ5_19410 [Ilyomonas sp.]
MKKCLVLCLLCFIAYNSFSQSTYDRAIGIKFPLGFAVTYKKFVSDNNNIEAQAMFWRKGFRAVGLYEFSFDIPDVEGLRWFVGPGAHIGFWKKEFKEDNNSSADIGIDGIIGLDYKVNDLPLNVSLDWQPAITLIGSSGFTPSYGGIGVRYTF